MTLTNVPQNTLGRWAARPWGPSLKSFLTSQDSPSWKLGFCSQWHQSRHSPWLCPSWPQVSSVFIPCCFIRKCFTADIKREWPVEDFYHCRVPWTSRPGKWRDDSSLAGRLRKLSPVCADMCLGLSQLREAPDSSLSFPSKGFFLQFLF